MDIEQLKVELEEYGFVIIHNLIPTDQAAPMTDRLIEIMCQQPDKDMPNQNLRGVFNYIVIFYGAIWHRGGANITTDKRRMGVSSGFHASWMDPAAGGWYLMKRSVRDRMPPEIQAMNRHVVED